MSFATITGVLKDAFGIVIPNQELLFEATKTSETVLNNTSAKVVTDSVGGYSVELNFGTYTLKTKQVREASYKTVASNILVYSTSYSGKDLQFLLLSQADLQNIDQSLIDQLLTIKIDVYAARDETILNAQEAVASKTNAAASATSANSSANAAASSATSASSSASSASSSATSASSSASSASSSATSATSSKNAAATSATNAATSATNAATSATNAATSASNAATSATLAGNFAASLNAVVPYTPAVNPTLDLDFAKQKYKWYAGSAGITESNSMTPLITFSRSSTATYFDAMGVMRNAAVDAPRIDYDPLTGECRGLLVEEQRTNLFPYSAYPASASAAQWWNRLQCDVYPNVAVAPDGTMTAAKAVVSVGAATTGNDGVGAFAMPSVTSSDTHTLTLYVKDAGAGYLRIRESINTGQIAKINLTTGAITAEAGYTSTTFTVATTDVGNGWWRVVVVRTPTTKFGFNLKPGIDVGDGVSGIYVWGVQVEAGAFPTSYIPTPATFTGRASTATYLDSNGVLQTAASGVARSAAYDYDADGVLRPIGLLLEGAATNLLLYSEQFDNTAWNKSACSVTANATTAPDGNTTADKIVEDTNTATHYVAQAPSVLASTTYTFSGYFKPAGRNNVRITLNDGTTGFNAYFDLVNGIVLSNTSGTSASVKKAANGFFRCSFTITTGASATGLGVYLYPADSTPAGTYTGDGASGVYVWGAQLAAGNYATSYIQTTSAQVTRAADSSTSAQTTRTADSVVISGTNFSQWYKQYEGTIVGEASNDSPTLAGHGFAVLSDGSDTNRIRIGSSTNFFVVTKDSTEIANFSVGTRGEYSYKLGCSFSKGSCIGGYQGNTSSVTASNIPVLNKLGIGVNSALVGLLNGHIRSLKYFPKPLAAAELQAMTA